MGEKHHTFQTAVWLSPADIAWIDARLQEITHVGSWRGVTRPACVRSLLRTARSHTPLHRESVTSAEARTARLSAKHVFPQGERAS